jgi:NAD(P) transhydrogenase subunit alpha
MKVGLIKEIAVNENRVALVPDGVKKLVDEGLEVVVQSRAGENAYIEDDVYRDAGATILDKAEDVYGNADIFPKVHFPIKNPETGIHEVDIMREGTAVASFILPHQETELLKRFAQKKITSFSMNLIPRITRAQSMDALSSQATVAGYKAALMGACSLSRFFPMLMTAAGTIVPARVFVIGAGVAGLQAIATAKRLGAVVEAFDIRPAVKEEVESLGARFVNVELEVSGAQDDKGYAREVSKGTKAKERDLISRFIRRSDVVITTALVPGKKAPRLITEDMVKGMRPGSVIVDLAAETGGNCELTRPGRDVLIHGVVIHGPENLPSLMPANSSQMYSKNIMSFMQQIIRDNRLELDFEDEVVKETCLTHDGRVLYEMPAVQAK